MNVLLLFVYMNASVSANTCVFNTLRTGEADLRFYVTTVHDG